MESPPLHHPTTTASTTISDPLLHNSTLITPEIQTLNDLALRGSWLKILDKTHNSLSLSTATHRHNYLVHLTFHILSLSKLRRYSDALSALDSAIPDFNSPSHATPSGSAIPFALRWLHAVLPSFLNRRADSIDRLYLLLSFTRSDAKLRSTVADTWRRREILVASTIIGIHCGQKEYLVCFGILNDMISKDCDNVELLSKLGYVQLQIGDVEGAKTTFSRVGELGTGKELNLVGRNRALVYLVEKDYVSAVREYDECIERDDSDVVSINNKALCLMYLRDLGDSIKVLEGSLERVPTVALNETLVVNLCSMYELAYVNHTDIKKTLTNWISRLAPDDFDSSCTRV